MIDYLQGRVDAIATKEAVGFKISYENAVLMTAFRWLALFILFLTTFLSLINGDNNFGNSMGQIEAAVLAAYLGFTLARAIVWYIHYEPTA